MLRGTHSGRGGAASEGTRFVADSASILPPEFKPSLRGWSHAGAAAVAVFFTIALAWRSHANPARLFTYLVFGLSMIELYLVSAIYHIGTWTGPVHQRLNAFDHANIFVQIAGTYTPICLAVVSGWLGALLLVAVWTQTVIGIRLSVFTRDAPHWVMPAICVAMGWEGVVALPSLLARLPAVAIGLIGVGGALYTIGALVYGFRWPNPFPRIFGFHEIFHLFVIGAGTAFAALVWFWIVPLP